MSERALEGWVKSRVMSNAVLIQGVSQMQGCEPRAKSNAVLGNRGGEILPLSLALFVSPSSGYCWQDRYEKQD